MIVDSHVHMNPFWEMDEAAQDVFRTHQPRFDEAWEMAEDPALFVEYLDDQGIDAAVTMLYVSPDIVGYRRSVNEYAAEYCDYDRSRLKAFAAMDLQDGVGAVHDHLDRIIDDLAFDGVKLHPPHQDVAPNAYRDPPVGNGNDALAAVYERCAEADLPVLIHSGTSIFPGARNVHGDPMSVDDVCIDFDCDVVMAHGGRPFHYDEAFFLYRQHDNLHFDISGIPPHRLLDIFPKLETIADRTMFGSDWPGPMVPDIGENVASIRNLDLPEDTIDGILGENAADLLDL